jgi:hypothetical protein
MNPARFGVQRRLFHADFDRTPRIARQGRGVHARPDRPGRTPTSSRTILYLDGTFRHFQEFGCTGTQSSRRVDSQTIEILRKCAHGEWTRFVRRLAAQPKDLVLEITEQNIGGRRFERRLVLERQIDEIVTGEKR